MLFFIRVVLVKGSLHRMKTKTCMTAEFILLLENNRKFCSINPSLSIPSLPSFWKTISEAATDRATYIKAWASRGHQGVDILRNDMSNASTEQSTDLYFLVCSGNLFFSFVSESKSAYIRRTNKSSFLHLVFKYVFDFFSEFSKLAWIATLCFVHR